jgi:hypothetical protein
MNWYNTFNAVEACLWGLVAVVIPLKASRDSAQQRIGVWLASAGFVAFGVTDLLEIGRQGAIPLWLWGFKIACGVSILVARYTWRGWNTFRWRDREVLFGLFCLASALALILLQRLGSI